MGDWDDFAESLGFSAGDDYDEIMDAMHGSKSQADLDWEEHMEEEKWRLASEDQELWDFLVHGIEPDRSEWDD